MNAITQALIMAAAIGSGTQAAPPRRFAPVAVSLTSASSTERGIGRAMFLRVSGDARGFEVEVTSRKPVRHCFDNRVHRASHGPDPSEVLPWQVAVGRFSNTRWIPVCGVPRMVEISLVSPMLSADHERFVGGQLIVRMTGPGT